MPRSLPTLRRVLSLGIIAFLVMTTTVVAQDEESESEDIPTIEIVLPIDLAPLPIEPVTSNPTDQPSTSTAPNPTARPARPGAASDAQDPIPAPTNLLVQPNRGTSFDIRWDDNGGPSNRTFEVRVTSPDGFSVGTKTGSFSDAAYHEAAAGPNRMLINAWGGTDRDHPFRNGETYCFEVRTKSGSRASEPAGPSCVRTIGTSSSSNSSSSRSR